jgi:hypothetical protein
MKALLLRKATVAAEPGSVVIISESQFKALGAKAVAYKEEAKEVKEEIKEEPKAEKPKEEPKKASKGSTSKKTSKSKK